MHTPVRALIIGLLAIGIASCGDRDPILFPSTAEVQLPVPTELEGPAGLSLTPVPVVRAVDSRGNPTPGVPVEFSVQEGAGSVSPASMLTDEQGYAGPDRWVLDQSVGRNVLAVDVEGVGRTEFVAEGIPGPPARLTRAGGDRQEGPEGGTLAEPIVVRILDQFGNPVPGEEVTFDPTVGGGSVFPVETETDASGFAFTNWTLGPEEGAQRLRATSRSGPTMLFGANAPFFVELAFVEPPDPAHQIAFENAAVRWESVFTNGLAPVNNLSLDANECTLGTPAHDEVVGDLLIFISLRPLEFNVLGQAGPCVIRLANGLPVVGIVMLNRNLLPSMEADGTLETVILHEIGHVLGIGTLWELTLNGTVYFDFLKDPSLPNNFNADPHFDGPLAISAFDAAGGFAYEGAKVPVENAHGVFTSPQGSLDSHWRMSVFGDELMVGQLDATAPEYPMSAITVASLADMGYAVDMGAADLFSVSPAVQISPPEASIEFHDDIYRGPIGVVDPEGRRVQELRPAPHR